eukprot:Tamp_28717.p1 GENE.Tamp_28717~~Tamp_28717.p1  ORF type:complete len:154 (+),score=29.18 Tamp_28717:288-749(+)
MGHVTDEEGPKSKRKGKKNGMKPGQALSFSGLEPRKWDGVDMLDMKQMIPRAIGGTFCMFMTIALVAGWCYHIIGGKLSQSLRESEGIGPSSHAAGSHGRVQDRHPIKHKALTRIKSKVHTSKHPLSGHKGQRRLLAAELGGHFDVSSLGSKH